MRLKTIQAVLAVAALFCGAQTAQSAILWTFQETGGNVVGAFTGTLNMAGMSFCCEPGFSPAAINASNGTVSTQLNGPEDFYFGISGPTLGPGFQVDATSFSGSPLFVSNFAIAVPDGYAGGLIDGTLTFDAASYASLGITPGTYVYNLANDTITVDFQVSAVPLPATLPLVLTALGMLGIFARRRA